MDWLRQADFASVNVDLICGLPRQTPERFAATLELVQQLRFATEWLDLRAMEADGLVKLQAGGEIRVTYQGRWLIRTIASLFDPAQRLGASGSRLV
jgi:oxygen-independent coproporphyrinogen-3 oxidase